MTRAMTRALTGPIRRIPVFFALPWICLLLCGLLPLAPATGQAPTMVEPPDPSAAADLPTLEDVAGTWYSDFGYMELEVKDGEIHGTYSCCQGTLQGILNVKRLELSWKDEIYGEGWAYLYWQEGGQRLEGVFGNEGDFGTGGQWNAARIPELETAEPPQRFRVEADHPRFGELEGTVLLDLSPISGEGEVRGELRARYQLDAQGKPFPYEMFNVLSGEMEGDELVLTWMDPVKLRRGEIRLQKAEASDTSESPGAWEGTWRPHFTTEGTEAFRLVPEAAP